MTRSLRCEKLCKLRERVRMKGKIRKRRCIDSKSSTRKRRISWWGSIIFRLPLRDREEQLLEMRIFRWNSHRSFMMTLRHLWWPQGAICMSWWSHSVILLKKINLRSSLSPLKRFFWCQRMLICIETKWLGSWVDTGPRLRVHRLKKMSSSSLTVILVPLPSLTMKVVTLITLRMLKWILSQPLLSRSRLSLKIRVCSAGIIVIQSSKWIHRTSM